MGCCASSDKSGQGGMERSGVNSCGNSARGESYRRGHSSRFSDVVSAREEGSGHSRHSGISMHSASTGSSGAPDDHDDADAAKDTRVAAPALFELMQMHPNVNPDGDADDAAGGGAARKRLATGGSQGAIPLPSVGTCSPESAERVDFGRRSTGRRFDEGSRTSRTSRSSSRAHGISRTTPHQGGIVVPQVGMDDSDTPWSQGTSASERSNSEAGSVPGYNVGDFEEGDVNLRDIHRPAGGSNASSDARRARSKHGPRVPRAYASPATKASTFPEYPASMAPQR